MLVGCLPSKGAGMSRVCQSWICVPDDFAGYSAKSSFRSAYSWAFICFGRGGCVLDRHLSTHILRWKDERRTCSSACCHLRVRVRV